MQFVHNLIASGRQSSAMKFLGLLIAHNLTLLAEERGNFLNTVCLSKSLTGRKYPAPEP